MKSGSELIRDERLRQITKEGWSAEHDAEHDVMEFVKAAQAYLMIGEDNVTRTTVWPWDGGFFKPKDDIKDLTRAGALIAAAIDRLQMDK
jgi:hypothetical protein